MLSGNIQVTLTVDNSPKPSASARVRQAVIAVADDDVVMKGDIDARSR
jgi:hypothetical protein